MSSAELSCLRSKLAVGKNAALQRLINSRGGKTINRRVVDLLRNQNKVDFTISLNPGHSNESTGHSQEPQDGFGDSVNQSVHSLPHIRDLLTELNATIEKQTWLMSKILMEVSMAEHVEPSLPKRRFAIADGGKCPTFSCGSDSALEATEDEEDDGPGGNPNSATMAHKSEKQVTRSGVTGIDKEVSSAHHEGSPAIIRKIIPNAKGKPDNVVRKPYEVEKQGEKGWKNLMSVIASGSEKCIPEKVTELNVKKRKIGRKLDSESSLAEVVTDPYSQSNLPPVRKSPVRRSSSISSDQGWQVDVTTTQEEKLECNSAAAHISKPAESKTLRGKRQTQTRSGRSTHHKKSPAVIGKKIPNTKEDNVERKPHEAEKQEGKGRKNLMSVIASRSEKCIPEKVTEPNVKKRKIDRKLDSRSSFAEVVTYHYSQIDLPPVRKIPARRSSSISSDQDRQVDITTTQEEKLECSSAAAHISKPAESKTLRGKRQIQTRSGRSTRHKESKEPSEPKIVHNERQIQTRSGRSTRHKESPALTDRKIPNAKGEPDSVVRKAYEIETQEEKGRKNLMSVIASGPEKCPPQKITEPNAKRRKIIPKVNYNSSRAEVLPGSDSYYRSVRKSVLKRSSSIVSDQVWQVDLNTMREEKSKCSSAGKLIEKTAERKIVHNAGQAQTRSGRMTRRPREYWQSVVDVKARGVNGAVKRPQTSRAQKGHSSSSADQTKEMNPFDLRECITSPIGKKSHKITARLPEDDGRMNCRNLTESATTKQTDQRVTTAKSVSDTANSRTRLLPKNSSLQTNHQNITTLQADSAYVTYWQQVPSAGLSSNSDTP